MLCSVPGTFPTAGSAAPGSAALRKLPAPVLTCRKDKILAVAVAGESRSQHAP